MGGSGTEKSIETFPANANCTIPPFPQPGNLFLILLFSSQGRSGHSLSVVDNGRELVACGGRYTKTSCISWRSGQDEWTHYATLRSYKISDCLAFHINPISSQERDYHAAVVMQGDNKILIIGGWESSRSKLTGEIVKSKFAF